VRCRDAWEGSIPKSADRVQVKWQIKGRWMPPGFVQSARMRRKYVAHGLA